MKILVVGRGSMGRRRIRDLERLGHDVRSWDIVDDPKVAVNFGVDAIVVSTPPDQHRIYNEVTPHFIEAGVRPAAGPAALAYPSCTARFTDFYELFQGLPLTQKATAYTLHVGMHIADWHPGTDLGTYYAAQRATGACREMVPFELCWLTGLFGSVEHATALRENTADVAPIDDVYQVLVLHKSGVLGHLLIDALSRPPRRSFTMVSAGDTRTYTLDFREEHYAREIRTWTDAIAGRASWPYSQKQELANLRVLERIG